MDTSILIMIISGIIGIISLVFGIIFLVKYFKTRRLLFLILGILLTLVIPAVLIWVIFKYNFSYPIPGMEYMPANPDPGMVYMPAPPNPGMTYMPGPA